MIPIRDDNPSKTFPVFNILFILINCALFILQITSEARNLELLENYAMIPSVFFSDPLHNWFRPFTYMFLHGGWLHLIGNMLFLYIFGDNVEDIFGHFGYILFYFMAGCAGALLQSIFSIDSTIPLVGASGAISGVIAAYMLLFPLKSILTLIFLGFIVFPVKIPAVFYIAVWIGGQFLSGLSGLSSMGKAAGGVAYMAHIGGIILGLIFGMRARRIVRKRRNA